MKEIEMLSAPWPAASPCSGSRRFWLHPLLLLLLLLASAGASFAQSAIVVPNAGFETPSVGSGGGAFTYNPSGASWSFVSNAGVSGNSSGFTSGNPAAPEGNQVAFVQITGSISQSLTGFQSGTAYTLTVSAAQRGNNGTSTQSVQVSMDGTVLGTITPSGTNYSDSTFTYTPQASGAHTLQFLGLNPNGGDNTVFLDNVRILPASTSAIPVQVLAINAGGGAAAPFVADTDYDTGSVYSTGTAIDTSAVTNPAPQGVYQTERYGNFTYTLPGLTPGASYTLRLHFAEIFYGSPGQRQFNVFVNGTQVLTNFDIVAAAGGPNKAVIKNYSATANSSGQIVVQFANGAADAAKVDGLEVLSTGASVPSAPAGLTATAGNASVALSWTPPGGSGLTYNVKRATTSGGPYTTVGSSGGTGYTDSGLTNGTAYYYVVTAVGSAGESGSSNQASATPSTASLLAPALSAQAQNTQAALTWNSITGATSYNLYRSTTPGGEGTTPYKTGLNYSSYSDSSLTNGTTYYYQVTATSQSGEGPKSNEASATPGAAALAAPVLKGTTSGTQNTLTWSAIAGATSYNLYRTSGNNYYGYGGNLYQQGLTGTTFTDPGLTSGTQYSYYVCAVNTSGQGSQSNTVSLTPGSTALAAPLLSAQASSGQTYISLSWTIVTGATSYNLYRSTTAGGEGVTPYEVGVNSGMSDSGLTAGTTYYYKVVAVGPGGEGASSNEASATVGTTPLAAPILKGVAGATSNALTWSAVSGATSYNLYRTSGSNYYGYGGTLYQQGLTSTTFSDTSLTSGTAYSYYVCAVNTSGQGNQSNTVSLTPGSAALAAPLLSAQTSSGQTSISLNWTAVTGASSYNVYRSTTAGGEGSIPYQVGQTGTSYYDSGLTAGTTYYYKVVAVGPGGEGTFSNEASATVGTAPLAAPILKGVAGATTNTLTWSVITGATSYNLYRTTGNNYYGYGGNLYQQGLTGTTFSDAGLTGGTQYSYYVAAVNTSGQGTQSNTVSLTPGSTALAAPLLSAQAYSAQVSLSWTSVTGASSYNLYRSTTPGGEGATPYQVGLTSTSYSDSSLTNGTTYYYKVVAVGPGGEGTFSNEASAIPGSTALAAPILKGVAGATSNALTWSAVSGATSYNLYRTTGNNYYGGYGYGGTLYQQGLTSTTFSDTGLTSGTQYNYYVAAVNTSGQGNQSNTVSLTPGSTALAAPLLSASTSTYTNNGLGSISLSWTAVAGATSYNVYRSTTAGGEGSVPYQVGQTGTSYNDGSLTPGTTYYYKVVAVGPGGEGVFSNEASATVASAPLPAPSSLTATAAPNGGQSIALAWGAVSGATSYNIYRSTSTSSSQGYNPGYNGTLYRQGVSGTAWTDTSVQYGPTYTYAVSPVSVNGQGTQSNTASAALIGFSFVASPTALTVTRGAVEAVTVTLTPSGGLTGPVSLSGTGLPSGTSAWFYPSFVTLPVVNQPYEYTGGLPSEGLGGAVSSSLYLAIPASAAPGTYSITVSGATGSIMNSAVVTLTIQ